MGIFDDADFTVKERAERNLPLPEILKAKEIAELWSDNKRQQEVILVQIKKAIEIYSLNIQPHNIYSSETKSLKTLPNFLKVYEDGENIYVRWSDSKDEWVYDEVSAKISRQDFIDWLNIENEFLSKDCLLQKWLIDTQLEIKVDRNDVEVSQTSVIPNERELTKFLRETWINEGKPSGTKFFDSLKKYSSKKGSTIVQHFTSSSNGPGIMWNTGNYSGEMTKKTIQNKVSKFKKESLIK